MKQLYRITGRCTEQSVICRRLTDGERVANTTLIDALLDKDFQLLINDAVYHVRSPEKGTDTERRSPRSLVVLPFSDLLPLVCLSSEHAMGLEDMKHIVHLLHTALHQPEHHLLKERQLLERLDSLKQELSPLEKVLHPLHRPRAR